MMKTAYKLLFLMLVGMFLSCSDNDSEKLYSTELGSLTTNRANVYTGQKLSFIVVLPECVQKNEAKVLSHSWSRNGVQMTDKGVMGDGTEVMTDVMPSDTCDVTIGYEISFSYEGKNYTRVASCKVKVEEADALSSVWGETPEETMLNVPVSLNYNTGRYEYYDEEGGFKNSNSLWSYYYINNKLYSISHLLRKFQETDSMCLARYVDMYKQLKKKYDMPVNSADAKLMENIIQSSADDSLYSWALHYYGKCLHSGKIPTSDSTETKFSLHIDFINKKTRVRLYAIPDSATMNIGGVYYQHEYVSRDAE